MEGALCGKILFLSSFAGTDMLPELVGCWGFYVYSK